MNIPATLLEMLHNMELPYAEDIDQDTALSDLDLDSLSIAELNAAIVQVFHIHSRVSDLKRCRTVGEVAAHIRRAVPDDLPE